MVVRLAMYGLDRMQQRYYDPAIGRFLSVDPVATNPSTGSSFNRYWYANNNPYRFTDPDGRQSAPFELPVRQYDIVVETPNPGGATQVDRLSVSDHGIGVDSVVQKTGSVSLEPQHQSAQGAPAKVGDVVMDRLLNFSAKEGQTVQVTSGQRTPQQNASVNGAANSQHLADNAADIKIAGYTRTQTADAAYNSGEFNRVNEYPDPRGVHVDLRPDGKQGRFYDWDHQHD